MKKIMKYYLNEVCTNCSLNTSYNYSLMTLAEIRNTENILDDGVGNWTFLHILCKFKLVQIS